MTERWLPIIGYEGLYEVSDHGRVRRIAAEVPHRGRTLFVRERMLIPLGNAQTGLRAVLSQSGKTKMFLIHRMVAVAFLPNPTNLPNINHLDFDRTNNLLSNLEWCTQAENLNHSARAGRMSKRLTADQVVEIKVRLAAGGESHDAIGKRYGVSQAAITRISQEVVWKHVVYSRYPD